MYMYISPKIVCTGIEFKTFWLKSFKIINLK